RPDDRDIHEQVQNGERYDDDGDHARIDDAQRRVPQRIHGQRDADDAGDVADGKAEAAVLAVTVDDFARRRVRRAVAANAGGRVNDLARVAILSVGDHDIFIELVFFDGLYRFQLEVVR